MLLRPSRQSGTSVDVRLSVCLLACVQREWKTTGQRQKKSLTSAISAARWSICVCHPAFVTGVAAFVFSNSWWQTCFLSVHICLCDGLSVCLPCSINNSQSHNPNLTSPQPSSEQHKWYMATSGWPLCYRFSVWWMETSAGQSIPNLSPTVLI